MKWPFTPPDWLACQHGQAPPLQYFFKIAQVVFMLLVQFFSFDSFFKYSTQNGFEYLEKQSNAFAASLFSKICISKKKKAGKFKKSSRFGETWYFCRGPPPGILNLESHLLSVFRGHEKCSKYQLLKFLPTFFKITKWALVYL